MGNLACEQSLVCGPEDTRSHAKELAKAKRKKAAVQALEPARRLWETLSTQKITNPDWTVICLMDSFIQPLNNQARVIALGMELFRLHFCQLQFVAEVKQRK